jgi:hypothetical protein
MTEATSRHYTLEPSLEEAVRKIIEGYTELAVWAFPKLPGSRLGGAVWRRVMGVLQTLRAQAEVDTLNEIATAAHDRAMDHDDSGVEHPDQTSVHLGPHHINRHPVDGGIRVHPDPRKHATDVVHPHGALRHH